MFGSYKETDDRIALFKPVNPCWGNSKEFADFLHIFMNKTAILKLKGMKALALLSQLALA
jgi:hypothetical protein